MFDQLFREHLCAIYEALHEPIPPQLKENVDSHEQQGDRNPSSFIHPIVDGLGDEQDWDKAGRIEIGGARGTMHRASLVQRVFYGLDHLNFYLRLDFSSGLNPQVDLPPELHLVWFYPGVTMYNSSIPLENLPNVSPLNYLFHHHLGINLRNGEIWFAEAGDRYQWHSQETHATMALDQCLEVAVPWSDLNIHPDYPLRIVAILADNGQYKSYFPEDRLIGLQAP
ncbi:MAG: glycoside hydrolase, partial [Kamptonema sp. SIO4C4]|nr:glycoside hydrolase [Kamptonema sp. SIO4C4]